MSDRLDHFRGELEAAAHRQADAMPATGRPARRAWTAKRPAVAIVAVVAIAGATAVATGIDGGRPDPLAAAAAALDPDGAIVHMVIEGGVVNPDGSPAQSGLSIDGKHPAATIGRRIEQWSAGDPLRFRSDQPATTATGAPLGTISDGITADGTVWSDLSWDGRPARTSTTQEAAPYGDIADVGAFGTVDPARTIRRDLRAKRFTVGATTRVDGRDAIELVATTVRQRGTTKAPTITERLVYLADADTYAPVGLKTYQRVEGSMVPARDRGFRLRSVLRIRTYERLSSDDVPAGTFRVPGRAAPRP
ncbi:hypothetical protein AB0L40_05500 [Patulibacter sp. NPDC049589]|uniref:hypothetical protein n=1 Tax=Patulibacter sp. NPDC049589 TaxID=3154731 RepID=UPI0034201F74